ncbi:MAG TPA: hypothetical protein VLC48_00660 [Gemmatimonadota bacterium]|nr:hypothetical protein [Gemmatimonadota bacterium]
MSFQDRGTINFLHASIGRGHPHYLDGIVESLPADRVGEVTDVFASTSGLGRAAWRAVRAVYMNGGRGGWRSLLYNRLRAAGDYNRPGPVQVIMGRALREKYVKDPEPLVVAHPLLAAILRGKPNLFYQHGELAAPRECWVEGGQRICVPLPQTADVFLAAGFDASQLFVSGLCIEPALVAQAEGAFAVRAERLAGNEPLCGGYFSSGAEPRPHVESLARAAASAVAAGGHAVIVARRSGQLASQVTRHFAAGACELQTLIDPLDLPPDLPPALLCIYDDRRELNEYTARLFGRFDYFVSPAHERSHWALGVGLPMFVTEPVIGSYASANREFVLAASVAEVIPDPQAATRHGDRLGELRRTEGLQAMARAGWGRHEIRGFANIAEMLLGSGVQGLP